MASEPPSTIEPPRKRARENSESTESDTPDVKSAQLWFTDGNIILRTVSNATAPQRTVYKVHKSVLALHATFFRDLFDGPQAAFVTGSESYEDLPLMDMPDSQMDVESFLKALYLPEYTRRHYASPRLKSLPEGYAGILRMATKYDAENLRETVVAAFKKLWPSKLIEWLELQKYIDDEAKLEDVAGTMVNVSYMYADPAKAVRLAMDCNVPDILPTAYYDLARVYTFNRRCAPTRWRNPDMSVLTTAELLALLSGIGEIHDLKAQFVRSFNPDSSPPLGRTCTLRYAKPGSCQSTALALWQAQIKEMDPSSGDVVKWLHEKSNQLNPSSDPFDPTSEICQACANALCWKQRHLHHRDLLWGKLPVIFSLKDVVSEGWGPV